MWTFTGKKINMGYSQKSNVTLVNEQLDIQVFYFIIRLSQSSTCFKQHHEWSFIVCRVSIYTIYHLIVFEEASLLENVWIQQIFTSVLYYNKKGKAVPLQAWSGPEGSRKLRFPDFITTAQGDGKVVSLTHRPHLPPRKSSWYSFLLEVESTPGP